MCGKELGENEKQLNSN